jgi:hypothetical protein
VGRFTTQVLPLAVLLTLVLAAAAQAGTMRLYSCQTPSGRVVGTHGWSAAASLCSSTPRGFLQVTSPATYTRFDAAADTSIGSFIIDVCGQPSSEEVHGIAAGPMANPLVLRSAFGGRGEVLGCTGAFGGGGPDVTRIAPVIICWGSCSSIRVYSLRADVVDAHTPKVANVTGSLIASATQTTTETVRFDATDLGVGVLRSTLEARIDRSGEWEPIVSARVQSTETCRPLGETDYLYEFDSPQPCPLSVKDAELVLKPGVLPVGSHDLRVNVEDAAGNKTPLVAAKVYTVPAPPVVKPPPVIDDPGDPGVAPGSNQAANGTPIIPPETPTATGTAQLTIAGGSSRTVKGSGATSIQGRLTDASGNPIAGAALSVQARALLPKPRTGTGIWEVLGTTTTNGNGEYRATVPKGASRTVLITYRRLASDVMPAALAQTDLLVPATITVSPKRTRVRNGRSFVVNGRVAGPIPRGGVPVALEVREPGRWIPVATTKRWVRTKTNGRFTLSYRFRSTFEPATYRFRVVADEDSAFAYTRGVSRTIPVRVRP